MSVVQTHQAFDVLEGGVTELVGPDESLENSKYSASVGVTLDAGDDGFSGEIVSVAIISYETGSGAVQKPQGKLYIFDADPALSANSASLAAAGAEHKTAIGFISISSSDWDSDANGAVAYAQVAVPFHKVKTLYFSFRLNSAETDINEPTTGGGDDEHIDFNFWYRREK